MDSQSLLHLDIRYAMPEKDGIGQTYDFFFYGTLLVPDVLVRVLAHKGEGLIFQEAELLGYERHCVRGADYPAITPVRTPSSAVKGTLVKGLNAKDVGALDVFEGDEYGRLEVSVQTLSPPLGMEAYQSTFQSLSNSAPQHNQTAGSARCLTYVWKNGMEGLENAVWSFDEFMRDKAHLWVGTLSREDYDEVDRHRALVQEPAMNGRLSAQHSQAKDEEIEGQKMEGFPDFGHNMLKYWKFDPKYVNLNHGSYGSVPIPVLEAMNRLSDRIESNPDHWMRRGCLPMLNETRSKLASLLRVPEETVVIVTNTTHGINTIVYNLQWQPGDVIVLYSTTYGAVGQMMKCVCDRNPGVEIEVIDLVFPLTHAEILQKTRAVLDKHNLPSTREVGAKDRTQGKRVKMVLIDSISSNPGMIFPWQDLSALCKDYGVYSLIDAAHSIGQHHFDLSKADPDFWVTNCHKWLMSHRGGSVMYVPLRNQHLMRTSFPTSHLYESTQYPGVQKIENEPKIVINEKGERVVIEREWSFTHQYEWTGTPDWRQFITIMDAMRFREDIGGEERIIRYCHDLAVKGGQRVSKRWGTEVMDLPDHSLTAAMVNVAMPGMPPPATPEEQYRQLRYLEDGLFAGKTYAAPYLHGGKWWARFSAQVWNELEDFDVCADVLRQLAKDIIKGKHLQVTQQEGVTQDTPKDMPNHDE